jgi:hypothetical protein
MQLAGTLQVNEETNVCTINQYNRRAVITEITSSFPLPSIQKLPAEQQTCTKYKEKLSELDVEYHKQPIHIKKPKKTPRNWEEIDGSENPTISTTKKQRQDGETNKLSGDNKSVLWYPEVYPNVPKNVFDEQNIPQFGPRFIFSDRVRQLTTGPALLHFLKRGYKVSIRRADGSVYPCLYQQNTGELLNYGHRYPMHTILADAKLLHNDRVHAPISTSHKAANIIVLTQ